jgi:methionyl-tRNA formyltransferase
MRLLFMGTAPFACPTLEALLASPHEVAAVVTQPDRPRGRGRKLVPTAVKALALEHRLAVLQPPSLRASEVLGELTAWRPEAIVVVAYGNILPSDVLHLPPYGCLNLHASLLPKYRGPAPLNWTLINGETETGYTIIQMDEHVDTGPILRQEACAVRQEDDAISLGTRLAQTGATGMVEVLTTLEHGALTPQPQPDQGVSQAPKLTRDLGRMHWEDSASTLHNLVRGLVPWPCATTAFREAEVKLWRTGVDSTPVSHPPGTITAVASDALHVACGKQHLIVYELQPASRRRMPAGAFVQGARVRQGDRFASLS